MAPESARLRAFAILTLMVLAGLSAGLILGAKTLNPGEIIAMFTRPDDALSALVWRWRLPRVCAAFLVGALLATSGVLFQGAFRNPLAEPYLLGTASGASLGAAVALLIPLGISQAVLLPTFAFLGALGAVSVVLAVCRTARIGDAAGMLLVGVASAAILSAGRALVTLLFSDESVSLRAVMSWMLGGIQNPTLPELVVFTGLTGVCLWAAVGLGRGLDLLGFGEATARTMGVPVQRLLTATVVVGALAAGLAVAVGGVIGFVGLVAPHIVRWRIGPSHARLAIYAALFGGAMVAALDGVARAVVPPSEIPLGLITALVGGPFFLALLARRRP